jgi:hypothetical protein
MSENLSGDEGEGGECKSHFQTNYFYSECFIRIASHQATALKSAEKPPLPRNETELCGLQNQGATW